MAVPRRTGSECGQSVGDPLYIGNTESLSERLPTHEKWSAAQLLGATHIHARVERVRETRVALEKELVAAHLPKLNIDDR